MSQKHIKKLKKVFEHPVSTNLDTHKLISALEYFGCRVEHTKNNKIKIFYNESEIIIGLHHSGSLSKDEVLRLRHFLEGAGLTPDKIA